MNKKKHDETKKNAVNTHFLTKYRNYPILSRLIRTKILTIPCFYFINVKWNIANGLSFVLTLTTRDVTANNQNGATSKFRFATFSFWHNISLLASKIPLSRIVSDHNSLKINKMIVGSSSKSDLNGLILSNYSWRVSSVATSCRTNLSHRSDPTRLKT